MGEKDTISWVTNSLANSAYASNHILEKLLELQNVIWDGYFLIQTFEKGSFVLINIQDGTDQPLQIITPVFRDWIMLSLNIKGISSLHKYIHGNCFRKTGMTLCFISCAVHD